MYNFDVRVRIIKRKVARRGKEYVSYGINIPKAIAEALSLSQAEELELELKEIEGRLALVLYKP